MNDMYKILLVDDDEDILWINQLILSDAGYSVDIFTDPEKALLKVYSEDYSVAVLDYMMPKIKGDKLAKKILKIKKSTGIIFLTGYSEFATYMETVEDSISLILLKPISGDELIEAVTSKIEQVNIHDDLLKSNQIIPNYTRF